MHYKDGTPAAIGDVVKGKPYNTPNEVVGTMVYIKAGLETCNCRVAFLELVEVINVLDHQQLIAIKGADGISRAIITRIDYGQCSDFLKIV